MPYGCVQVYSETSPCMQRAVSCPSHHNTKQRNSSVSSRHSAHSHLHTHYTVDMCCYNMTFSLNTKLVMPLAQARSVLLLSIL